MKIKLPKSLRMSGPPPRLSKKGAPDPERAFELECNNIDKARAPEVPISLGKKILAGLGALGALTTGARLYLTTQSPVISRTMELDEFESTRVDELWIKIEHDNTKKIEVVVSNICRDITPDKVERINETNGVQLIFRSMNLSTALVVIGGLGSSALIFSNSIEEDLNNADQVYLQEQGTHPIENVPVCTVELKFKNAVVNILEKSETSSQLEKLKDTIEERIRFQKSKITWWQQV